MQAIFIHSLRSLISLTCTELFNITYIFILYVYQYIFYLLEINYIRSFGNNFGLIRVITATTTKTQTKNLYKYKYYID